jgi:hypothetical protein
MALMTAIQEPSQGDPVAEKIPNKKATNFSPNSYLGLI